jgi:hypothetical protein
MAETKVIPPAKKEEIMFETLALITTAFSFYFAYRRLRAKKKQL